MAKILIVEDNLEMRRMYQRAFTFGGYQVEVAEDGQDGLGKIKTSFPDLVFLDIMMPKMNGVEVLTALKADTQTANIPVVMMTNILSDTLAAAQEAVAKKLALRYIVKSELTPEQVVEVAEEILHG